MKKVLLLFIAIVAVGVTANAQQFGVKAGVNFSNININSQGVSASADGRTSFYVGGLVDFTISDKLHIQPEVLYSAEGSKNSDIRIIWGGEEAVTKIAKLPKKISCKDIIFGPKVSMAYISKTKINTKKDIKKFSDLFVNDVFNFDQLGCNSPHNLFVEKGSKFKLIEIAKILSKSFRNKILKINSTTDPANKYNILMKNFIHSLGKDNEIINDKNFEWNIYINKNPKIEDPLYNRSIFINSIISYKNLADMMPDNTQSIGLYVNNNEKKHIVKKLSYKCGDRFPDVGAMSLYENPWDGFLPMQNMIRWISY